MMNKEIKNYKFHCPYDTGKLTVIDGYIAKKNTAQDHTRLDTYCMECERDFIIVINGNNKLTIYEYKEADNGE